MAENFFPVSASSYRRFDTLCLDSDGNPPRRIYTLVDEDGNTLFENDNRELLRAILGNNDVSALAQYLTKNPEITESLYLSGLDVFYQAAASGGVDVLRTLLQHYTLHRNNMQSPNERGFLLLNIACKNCRVNTVRLLFDECPEFADVHARDENNNSAILAAAGWSGWNIDNEASRRDEIMHLLLDRGASAKDFSQWPSPEQVTVTMDQPRENVLTLAAPWAGPDLIKRLIDKGADPEEKTYTYNTSDRAVVWKKEVNSGVTALFVSSIYWNVEVVEMLLRHHKSSDDAAELVSQRDSCGRLPLHWAAGGSREGFHPSLMESPEFATRAVDTLKLLVESNPSAVNAQDNDGETPLHYAAHSYGRLTSIYKGVFQYLLENGADASIQNNEGRTPFQFLCDRFNDGIPLDTATMSLLCTESADLSHGDANGDTSLHKMASQWDRVEAVKFLLDRGADVAIKNLKGNTVLHEAAIGRFIPGYILPEKLRSGFDGIMKVLLEAGGYRVVNVKKTAGRTAREIFEDLWIGRRSYTIRDREDPYSRGGFGGRGRQKSPIYPLATSVHRGR